MIAKFFSFEGVSGRKSFLIESAIALVASLLIISVIYLLLLVILHPMSSTIDGARVVYSDPNILTTDQVSVLAKLLSAPVLVWMWMAVYTRRMRGAGVSPYFACLGLIPYVGGFGMLAFGLIAPEKAEAKIEETNQQA